jgi:hypothetical protein
VQEAKEAEQGIKRVVQKMEANMTQDEVLQTLREVIEDAQNFTTWTVSTPHLVELVNRAVEAERERLLQAVEEMRPVQNNSMLQNKPAEFWIRSFKQAIEARGQT